MVSAQGWADMLLGRLVGRAVELLPDDGEFGDVRLPEQGQVVRGRRTVQAADTDRFGLVWVGWIVEAEDGRYWCGPYTTFPSAVRWRRGEVVSTGNPPSVDRIDP